MKKGRETIVGNVQQTATGYLQLASGTTAQRPQSPANGMSRYNTTTNYVEIYMNGSWQNTAFLAGDEFKSVAGRLYRKSADGKWLSVGFSNLIFANSNVSNLSWLYIDPNITSASAGYVSPFLGTIVLMTAYTDRTNINKSVSLYVNDDETQNVVSFSGSQVANSVASSIDFSPGDNIRLRCRSNAVNIFGLGAVYVTVFFTLRTA